MRIKHATQRGFNCGKREQFGLGKNREVGLHDKYGLDVSPDVFLRLEGEREPVKRPKRAITLSRVSILERQS